MVQEQNSTKSYSNSEKKPNKEQSVPSQRKTEQHTKDISGTPNPGKKQSRNEKRKRWAKKNGAKAKPQSVRSAPPIFEYVSTCCSLLARKPRAGQKEMVKDAETGRTEIQTKGLGHWRCSGCGKSTTVSRRKPQSSEVPSQ